MRTDISRLEVKYPELAKEFKQLRNELNANTFSADTKSLQQATGPQSLRYTAAKRFDTLVNQIRALDGFERFLLRPSEEELMALASFGPIVIFNIAIARSDAFILNNGKIRCLHLPKLLSSDV